MMEVTAAVAVLATTVTMLASAMEAAASEVEVAVSGAAAKALVVAPWAAAAVWATGVAAAEAPPTLYTCGVCPSG